MTSDLSVYIPTDRRQALARHDDLRDRTRGAALFADISGFTPLTEALAAELGPKRGAEELTRHLNLIYGELIEQVDAYRGSVIGFSGDAITCWFDEDDGRRAVTSALAMQYSLQQHSAVTTPSGTPIPLAIKVAVSAGRTRRFRVGNPAVQYLDALAGVTLARLAAAEHEAQKGEIVLSAEVVANLGETVRVREWRNQSIPEARVAVIGDLLQPAAHSPWPTLSSSALSVEQIRPWLLPGLFERESAAQELFLAELRPAVALFVRFGGIDYDDDAAAGEKLDAFIRWSQNVLQRYEGALLQLTIGDKGSYFYAAFGAPLAHDDDAARAVAAALELRALSPSLSSIGALQIGLSQGRMRAGPYGGATRRTYGVLGDEVNVAARLMSKAEPGQILISQRMAELVNRHYLLRTMEAIPVKGKQKPIAASVVIGPLTTTSQQPASLYPNVLVGREAELAALHARLEDARRGQGQVLRLEGPAGIGKSHLLAEFALTAGQRDFRVAIGVCQSTTQAAAYAPWRQIMGSLLELNLEPAPDPEVTARQIATLEDTIIRLNPDWRVRLPLLGDLLGLPIADNATTAAFEPKLRQSALFDLMAELLKQLSATRPLLLVLDDVHWVDEASDGLTLAVARALTTAPVLLLLSHRPPLEGQPILPAMSELRHHHRLNLGELSPAGLATLVTNRLGDQPSPLLLSLVQAETQGNPFFAEEVVDALRELGHLEQRDGGRWYLTEPIFNALQRANALARSEQGWWVLAPQVSLSTIDLGLPDSVQGVVLSRIDRLSATDRLTLKVASVIGRIFELEVMAHAHPQQPDATMLQAQVGVLETREFARLEAPPPRTSYIFKHNVTREVAYDTLLFDQRRRLHRAVGEALERLAPETEAQIAYHAFAGEDWSRALRHLVAAGHQAQKLFANQAGIEHFRRALRCAENLPTEDTAAQQQLSHASLGELLTTLGQYDAALNHLQAALTLSHTRDDREAQARACRWIAYTHEFRGDYAAALEWIERGLQALGEAQSAAAAELLAIAGLVANRQGNYDLAQQHCDASIRIAEPMGALSALAFAHTSRGLVSYGRGDSAEAIIHYERAASLYEQASNIQGLAMASNSLGNVHFNLGRWTEAAQYLRQARDIFVQTGDELHFIFANNNLGGIALNQGRLDEALTAYGEALRALEKIGGSAYVIGAVHLNLGAAHVRRNDVAAARRYLQASHDHFNRAQTRDFLSEMHRYFAEAALLAGDLVEAHTQAQLSLEVARELTMRAEEGIALRVLGEVAATEGDLPRAEQGLMESVRILNEVGYEYEAARSQLSLARMQAAQEQRASALALLERCRLTFEHLGAALEIESARQLWGQL